MAWSNASRFEGEWPGQAEGRVRIRDGAASSVKKTLRWASALVLLRLAVLPWLILFYNYHRTLFIKDEPMVVSSVGLGAIFFVSASLSRTWPMLGVMISAGAFGWWCYYDIHRTEALMDAGLIGKSILGTLIIWAFMQAVMSRTL